MSSLNQSELLRQALTHHNAGQLRQAEAIYRQILSADQNCAEAWQYLGVLAHQSGHFEVATKMIQRAIALGMQTPDVYNNLGESFRCLGMLEDAVLAYHRAIQLHPNFAEALSNLGLTYNTIGRFADALPLLERATALQPGLANARLNYGVALASLGRLDEAIDQWQVGLTIKPDNLLMLKNLGLALQQKEKYTEAEQVLSRLVQLHPDYAEGHAYYGYVLAFLGKFEEGISEGQRAIELEPRDKPDLHNVLGLIYFRADRLDDALMAAKRAVRLDSSHFNSIVNIGRIYASMECFTEAAAWFERAHQINPKDVNVAQGIYTSYYTLRKFDKALEVVEKSLAIHPENPDLHFNRSTALLMLGNYVEGFKEYEWRAEHKSFNALLGGLRRTSWDGSDPAGKSMLICSEQGFGDIIQFARYIPLVVQMGTRVMVDVPWEVRPVIESIPGILRVVPMEARLSEFDLHVLLLSLPGIFKTTIETIPANVPYLFADGLRMERLKPQIERHGKGLKVGIVWGGNAIPDPRRSCSLKTMAILAEVPNCSWFSLQVGEHRTELMDAPSQMDILDLGRDFKDFADTAAAMALMDVVITIDTSAAHLAGAMGLKGWVILPYSSDWRWMPDGDTTPWYPTLRLFRQMQLDNWEPVLQQVRTELQKIADQIACAFD